MTDLLSNLINRNDIVSLTHNEQLSFEDEERISILESMHSIDVQACPGSGKTTLIAAKLILLAKKWPLSHQGICVLSHTNVAKDEIIERLKKSKTLEAQRLLSYPHFIGTIQEFVGKYIAFPYLRSAQIKINHVDTDLCVELIYSKISHATRLYIDRKSRFSNVLYDFDINYEGGEFSINVPTFGGNHTSQSYMDLHAVRAELISEGYFFYRDIFTYAKMVLSEKLIVQDALRKRFQLVFIDEMQDTQKFQDELICEIFPLGDSDVIIQRFGDPDQAIFHDSASEMPNDSFNMKSTVDMDYVVHKSHRFDAELAEKIKPLSQNSIPLETELSEEALVQRSNAHASGESFEHCVIIFNDDTRNEVIQYFGNNVSEQFHGEFKNSNKFMVKALGAVGNEIDPAVEQLKIGHYWNGYDKNRAKSNFKPNSLIEAARYCRQSSSPDVSAGYKLLFDSFLKLMRLAKRFEENGLSYTRISLRDFLKSNNTWGSFRRNLHLLLNDTNPLNQEYWVSICEDFILLLDLQDLSVEAIQYLAYEEVLATENQNERIGEVEASAVIPSSENIIKHPDGFDIHLSTIHGVKGETHDATLVMETKNHCFDLEAMLPYLIKELPNEQHQNANLPNKPHHSRNFKPNKIFMRQLYVAVSRPRHLLCLAIHTDRISQRQREALSGLGWCLCDLGDANDQ